MSFHCPKCDGQTGVYETRGELRGRKCKCCGYKFLTEEVEYDGKMLWPLKPKPDLERQRVTTGPR